MEMSAKANVMLSALHSRGELPLSVLLCNPPYQEWDDLSEFAEFQNRYCVLKMLVSKDPSMPLYAALPS